MKYAELLEYEKYLDHLESKLEDLEDKFLDTAVQDTEKLFRYIERYITHSAMYTSEIGLVLDSTKYGDISDLINKVFDLIMTAETQLDLVHIIGVVKTSFIKPIQNGGFGGFTF